MSNEVIQDWTDSTVLLKFGEHKDVRYKVYWDGAKLLQEIKDPYDSPIQTPRQGLLGAPARIPMILLFTHSSCRRGWSWKSRVTRYCCATCCLMS